MFFFKKKPTTLIKKVEGEGNQFNHNDCTFNNVTIDIVGDNNIIQIDRWCSLSNTLIHIRGSNHRLVIKEQSHIGGEAFCFNGSNNQIIIGKQTSIVSARFVAGENNTKIVIGEDCMFASHIDMRTTDSHSILDCNTGLRINPAKDIIIGNHVWVAMFVQVLKGVTIGDDCIIGSRAVVTKDIPKNCLAVGIPAHPIKQNVTWTRDFK